ncbi:MAG: MATE family efflux transporter [Dehalococcoidales bacterium]|nr:MATE family efflux transporter [Dehalococcoidales bacterium]
MNSEEDDSKTGRRRFDRDWTQGGIIRNLLSLSWPMVITNSIMMLGPTIDMIWVGKLGSSSIAGVGVSGMAVMMVNGAMMGLGNGMRAVVARYIGAGDFRGAVHAARQGFLLSASFAFVMALIGIFFAKDILLLFGLEPEVVSEGTAYMRILFIGSFAMSFRSISEGIMQASGDTISPMKMTIGFRLFHVALCPFLVFGIWIFPQMGVSGAAVTNVVSQAIGAAISLWFLFSGRTRLKLDLKDFYIDFNMVWRIVRIGFPNLMSGLQRNLSQLVVMLLISPFGTAAVAGHTVNQRIEMILMMPAMAFGMSSGVLMGQNLGAGKPDRAEKSTWAAVGLVEAWTIIASIILLLWAEPIVRLFNSEPAVVETTATFLRIAAAGYILLGFQAVTMNALSGAGDNVPAMITNIVTVWMVSMPLAYFLSKTDLGVNGVRWGMVAGVAVPAVALTIYFKMGRWKRKKV